MKRMISTLMVLTLFITSFVFVPEKVEAKTFSSTGHPKMNSIVIKWPKKKKAVKYIIYRTTFKYQEPGVEYKSPKKSKFKKVKATSINSFKDYKVKKNKYYIYYINAIGSKGSVISSSYKEDVENAYCKALERPYIYSNGNGEDYTNDSKHLNLTIRPGSWGYLPKKYKYQIFRRLKNEKKFKKIATVKNTVECFCDTKIKATKTYVYKVRSYYKKGKKKYYSKFSNTETMSAFDFSTSFKIQTLTKSGVYDQDELEVFLKLYDYKKTAADSYLLNQAVDYLSTDSKGNRYQLEIFMHEYSYDQKNWKIIPTDGIKIPRTKPIYIKAILSKGREKAIVFAGDDKANYSESLVDAEGGLLDYRNDSYGYTSSQFNLLKNRGSGYRESD